MPTIAEAKPRASALARLIGRRERPADGEIALQRLAARVVTPPLPPRESSASEGGGLALFRQLAVYCGLRPEHRVLEPGCGWGQNATAIAPYLDPRHGLYEGFDLSPHAVDWARGHITPHYLNVRFAVVDSRDAGAEHRFPYDDASFDVVFVPSALTHMTSDGLERYASEIARVLVPGGVLLSWHFLLDATARANVGASRAPVAPSPALAFDEAWTLELYESLGLRPQAVIHGHWSGREPEGLHDYQDRILARKN